MSIIDVINGHVLDAHRKTIDVVPASADESVRNTRATDVRYENTEEVKPVVARGE